MCGNLWGEIFLRKCRQGVLQFVVLKPLTATIALMMHSLHPQYYQEGTFSLWNIWLYTLVIDNISVSLSLYYLYLFYLATKDELKEYNAAAKFVAVKSIIFFSFWQGVIITILVRFSIITDIQYSSYTVAAEIQDFLICVEMLGIAILHMKVFSYDRHYKLKAIQTNYRVILSNCMDSTKLHDIGEDLMESFVSHKS